MGVIRRTDFPRRTGKLNRPRIQYGHLLDNGEDLIYVVGNHHAGKPDTIMGLLYQVINGTGRHEIEPRSPAHQKA